MSTLFNLLPYMTDSPTGQGPWLEVDGEKIAQSTAVARFLARRFGKHAGVLNRPTIMLR